MSNPAAQVRTGQFLSLAGCGTVAFILALAGAAAMTSGNQALGEARRFREP